MSEKITWKSERRKVKDLVPADYNPRVISEKERLDLRASIEEFDQVEPVVINLDDRLIGGHQRCGIYADLLIEEIDVRVPSRQLTMEEEVQLNLRLNKNTGGWDWARLSKLDRDMLEIIGFSQEEMRVNFGLSEAEMTDVGLERMQVLMVYPPESPRLKERMAIHFDSKEEYDRVKKAVEEGRLTSETILKSV